METTLSPVGTDGARLSLAFRAAVPETHASARGATRHRPTRIRLVTFMRTCDRLPRAAPASLRRVLARPRRAPTPVPRTGLRIRRVARATSGRRRHRSAILLAADRGRREELLSSESAAKRLHRGSSPRLTDVRPSSMRGTSCARCWLVGSDIGRELEKDTGCVIGHAAERQRSPQTATEWKHSAALNAESPGAGAPHRAVRARRSRHAVQPGTGRAKRATPRTSPTGPPSTAVKTRLL